MLKYLFRAPLSPSASSRLREPRWIRTHACSSQRCNFIKRALAASPLATPSAGCRPRQTPSPRSPAALTRSKRAAAASETRTTSLTLGPAIYLPRQRDGVRLTRTRCILETTPASITLLSMRKPISIRSSWTTSLHSESKRNQRNSNLPFLYLYNYPLYFLLEVTNYLSKHFLRI